MDLLSRKKEKSSKSDSKLSHFEQSRMSYCSDSGTALAFLADKLDLTQGRGIRESIQLGRQKSNR